MYDVTLLLSIEDRDYSSAQRAWISESDPMTNGD